MSAISIEQQQYKTYILQDDQAQLSVVPERGGMVTRWQVQGQDILYMDTERFKDPSLSVRGGIPLLFPLCGNVPDDTYSLYGQTYHLAQHGFARTLPWEVTAQSTEMGASLTLTLKSNADTRVVYPFDFELNFTYTLQGNQLTQRFCHTNLSEKPMPFSTGIHPYFAVADKPQLAIELPATEYKIKGGTEVYVFSGQFDFNQPEIDFAFINLQGQTATVLDKKRQQTLTLTYDHHYSTLVFWAVKGKDFYCLEPWSGPRNAMNTGEHLLVAAPGETVETTIVLTVE
jgi:galactose mutarotase-like enzyme